MLVSGPVSKSIFIVQSKLLRATTACLIILYILVRDVFVAELADDDTIK